MVQYTIDSIPNGCAITNNLGGGFTLSSPNMGANPNALSSSAIVYFQNTTGQTLNLQIGWVQTGDEWTYYDRIFWYSDSVQPTQYTSKKPTKGQYLLNSALNDGGNDSSNINGTAISNIGWNNFVNMNYTDDDFGKNQSGTQSITVNNNNWVAIMISADNDYSSTYTITGFTDTSICVVGDSYILMNDQTHKMIRDIKRGDQVIQDIGSNSIATVSQVIAVPSRGLVKIPQNLLGSHKDLIITPPHPVWVNNDNNRILASNIKGVEPCDDLQPVYTLQFDHEGTFYANNIKIDSLSPYHKDFKLAQNFFIDPSKYIPNYKVRNEDDPRRNKPKLINYYDPGK